MTKTEKLEALKKERFYLHMKDRWDTKDYIRDAELMRKINELEKEEA